MDYATQSDTVMLYPTDNMMTLLPKEGGAALTEQTFNLPKSIAAPVRQGDVVGTVTLTIEGEVIGTTGPDRRQRCGLATRCCTPSPAWASSSPAPILKRLLLMLTMIAGIRSFWQHWAC